jgi:hypothetical protein
VILAPIAAGLSSPFLERDVSGVLSLLTVTAMVNSVVFRFKRSVVGSMKG